ncbi:hypothetical protein [Brevibacillus sp. SAFN-007a]|uniref:hypothetical protein n=1 Tax=Brevibacillus sp. SAFN-007a TaxID=3436862 RepID=UPI003F7E8612
MNKIMSRIIAIYSLIWLTVLVIIFVTLEEITLYYTAVYTFLIGLIVLIGFIALKKILHIHSAHNQKQEALWGIIFAVLFFALIVFVIAITVLY